MTRRRSSGLPPRSGSDGSPINFGQAQERRRASQPRPDQAEARCPPVLHGDCLDLIPTLEDGSVGLVVTSPPYAEQRKGHYGGIPEAAYPEFTVQWMGALWAKLKDDGSVLIVIRPHLRDGVLSDYVLRTRLALREDGWNECEELIWFKPDAPPLGSKLRPRRVWESVLWFGKVAQPYCDLKACGKESDRLGFGGSLRFAEGGTSEKTGWHPCVESFGYGNGIARVTDVIVAPVGGEEPGVDHPAVFPVSPSRSNSSGPSARRATRCSTRSAGAVRRSWRRRHAVGSIGGSIGRRGTCGSPRSGWGGEGARIYISGPGNRTLGGVVGSASVESGAGALP